MIALLAMVTLACMLCVTQSRAQQGTYSAAFPNTSIWLEHFTDDILPYWMVPDALGTPIGNFPTYRDMNGEVLRKNGEKRIVRMLARQVYTYFMGYVLTGDPTLLIYARKGLDWIDSHAVDPRGGFFTELSKNGQPVSTQKASIDMAYISLAYSADFFVTRNPRSRQRVLETIDLMFQAPFRRANGTIVQGLDNSLTEEIEFPGPERDITAVLDQINAYLLLFTNQYNENIQAKRQLFYKVRRLASVLINQYNKNGIFVSNPGDFDYSLDNPGLGHTLKIYWMLHRISVNWQDLFGRKIYTGVLKNVNRLLRDAEGTANDPFWITHPDVGFGLVETDYFSWSQNEIDQLVADRSMSNPTFINVLDRKAENWLTSNFVDTTRPARGIRNQLRWDGSIINDNDASDAKAKSWKNGFHETEHCLVLHIASHAIMDEPLQLHFAVANDKDAKFIRPYLFLGNQTAVETIGTIDELGLIEQVLTFENVR